MPLLLCPNCNEGMQELTRNDVHIDVCPKCRGVWLDRGELEKLLHAAREVDAGYHREREDWERSSHAPGYQHHHRKPYKKKKSMFEVFDIFG